MTPDQIRSEIRTAIRQHEIRVALGSGFAGILLLAGTWHAIFMLRCVLIRNS